MELHWGKPKHRQEVSRFEGSFYRGGKHLQAVYRVRVVRRWYGLSRGLKFFGLMVFDPPYEHRTSEEPRHLKESA